MAATNRYMNVGPVQWTPTSGTLVTVSGIKSAQVNDGFETLLESADYDLYHTVGGVTMTAPTITLRSIDAFSLAATVGGQTGEIDITFRDFYNGATASGGAKKVAMIPSFLGQRSRDAEYRQLATQSLTFMSVSTDGATNPIAITAL